MTLIDIKISKSTGKYKLTNFGMLVKTNEFLDVI